MPMKPKEMIRLLKKNIILQIFELEKIWMI